MNAPTMEDVARAAGVHRTTVSRALMNHPRISKETCLAVQKIARELGYRVNPLISALMSQRAARSAGTERATLGYLSWETSEMWETYHVPRGYREGAVARAVELGYRMDIFRLAEDKLPPKRLARVLQARGIPAVCVGPLPRERSRVHFPWADFAAVSVSYSLLSPELHRASIHHFQNSFLAIRHLRHLGYRKIGLCLRTSLSSRGHDGWLAAFLVARERHPQEQFSLWLCDEMKLGAFQKWFLKQRPDAIIAEDPVIEGFLNEMGVGVPEEVGLATLDWNPMFPHWTGVFQNADKVGAAAVDLLVSQLHHNDMGVPAFPKTTLVEGTWKRGETLPRIGDKLPVSAV